MDELRRKGHVVTIPAARTRTGRRGVSALCSCGWRSEILERHWVWKQAESHLDQAEPLEE